MTRFIQGGSYCSERATLLPKSAKFSQGSLFGWVWLKVPLIGGELVPEANVADALALGAFVAQCVARAFAYGFAFPLADSAHNRDDQASGCRAGIMW